MKFLNALQIVQGYLALKIQRMSLNDFGADGNILAKVFKATW